MVLADIIEWLITQKIAKDHSMSQALTKVTIGKGEGARRIGSILSLYFSISQDAGIDKATDEFDKIKTAVTGTSGLNPVTGVKGLTNLNKKGEKLAEAIKGALKGKATQIQKLIQTEFGLKEATVSAGNIITTGQKIEVTIGGSVGTSNGDAVKYVFAKKEMNQKQKK